MSLQKQLWLPKLQTNINPNIPQHSWSPIRPGFMLVQLAQKICSYLFDLDGVWTQISGSASHRATNVANLACNLLSLKYYPVQILPKYLISLFFRGSRRNGFYMSSGNSWNWDGKGPRIGRPGNFCKFKLILFFFFFFSKCWSSLGGHLFLDTF